MRRALYPYEPAATIEGEIDEFNRTRAIDGHAHGVFVAVLIGEALGFAEVSDAGRGECHVESWSVHPEERIAGIGRSMLMACEAWAPSR